MAIEQTYQSPQQQPLGQSSAQYSGHGANQNGGTPATTQINLTNNTNSSNVYAFIQGPDIDSGNALFFLTKDAKTLYYPPNPPTDQYPLQEDCAIYLGKPGDTVVATVPHTTNARIWFSIGPKLTLLLNRGGDGHPAVVQPSLTNDSDPNATVNWSFAEFTYDYSQMFANISYVDFVGLRIALQLDVDGGPQQSVPGLPQDGLQQVAAGLAAQQKADGLPWQDLIVYTDSTKTDILRVLSPNQWITVHTTWMAKYYDDYVAQAYAKYEKDTLMVDTQVQWGVLQGKTVNNQLVVGNEAFDPPSTADIFGCSSGPFVPAAKGTVREAIIPRIAAAFNRSTLLVSNDTPATPDAYYQNKVANHYSRILHNVTAEGKGYAFPFDDVQATGYPSVAGEVNAGGSSVLTVFVGGMSKSEKGTKNV